MSDEYGLATATQALHCEARKRVTFAAETHITEVIHVKDFSDEERSAAWYSRSDLRMIKEEAKRTAYLDRAENPLECFRGLEAKTATGARLKRQKRIDARAAVFFEQEMQECDGYSDPEAIADLYFEHTESSQVEAQMLAIRDAAEVTSDAQVLKMADIDLSFLTTLAAEEPIAPVSAAA